MINNDIKKIDKTLEYFIVHVIVAVLGWIAVALYIWVGSYDMRFYNLTKNVKYLLVIISFIYTTLSVYYLTKYTMLKLKMR